LASFGFGVVGGGAAVAVSREVGVEAEGAEGAAAISSRTRACDKKHAPEVSAKGVRTEGRTAGGCSGAC